MESCTATRIDIDIVDSHHKRDIELKECYLILYDKHVEYKCVYNSFSDDNDEAVWKETVSNYRWTRLRSRISHVEMLFNNPEDKWQVSLEFSGVADPNGWLFNSPKEALRFYTQLQNYFLGR